jgi:hypothetical protein
MGAEDTCRLAAELAEEYGDVAFMVAGRAIATYEAEGRDDRAAMWRVLHAILGDIAVGRFDPSAPIAIH